MNQFSAEPRPGFRLRQVEVYNWGTFHERIWRFDLQGENALLTGNIGSGKSTLVDAVTTLLVPAHRIAYNKAAGAEAKERTLRSYVLGHYKSEKGGDGPGSRPVGLRGASSYSVILAVFNDAVRQQQVTIAQVFWCRDPEGPPARLFVVADAPLSIREDFTDFGKDLSGLRKRLRARPQCEVHEGFPPYGAALQRRLGASEQALELFHQTVSMKAVGNLTEFVRSHMLEPSASEPRIEALLAHFSDLTKAHQAVLNARTQIEALTPLLADCDRHAEIRCQQAERTACREALSAWFAGQKLQLCSDRLARLEDEKRRQKGRIAEVTQQRDERDAELTQLITAIASNGGDRLNQIERERGLRQKELAARRRLADRLKDSCATLEQPFPGDVAGFLALQAFAAGAQQAQADGQAQLQNQRTEQSVALHGLQDELKDLLRELESLRQRSSNLDSYLIGLRRTLCSELELDEAALPFAGELLQVRSDERSWQGAIERVLGGLGRSLLVRDQDYSAVSTWIDAHEVRTRLIYYHIRTNAWGRIQRCDAGFLPEKIEIHPQTWAQPWLLAKLHQEFPFRCCDSLEDFQRGEKALTRRGQIKYGGGRHEKDDRRDLDNPQHFVLGWSNSDKIAALERRRSAVEGEIATCLGRLGQIDRSLRVLEQQAGALRDVLGIGEFPDFDVVSTEHAIRRLDEEIVRINSTSDVLQQLQRRKVECEAERRDFQSRLDVETAEQARILAKQDATRAAIGEAQERISLASAEIVAEVFPRLEQLRSEQPSARELTIESAANCESDWRRWLQGELDALTKKLERLSETIVSAMGDFRKAWPEQTQELDDRVEAAAGYRALLDDLQRNDLPRFEADFKRSLQVHTINEIANFQAQLQRQQRDIEDRIAAINRSLHGIDFNHHRYIVLVSAPTAHAEVLAFRKDLRACIENSLGAAGDDAYSETKYQQVVAIIDRLRGRTGFTDIDRRWRELVTDVRNWCEFSASERWRDSGEEHEHYADSGGKSGGQKEKLAYTVLAASLAYQYGLTESTQPRSFRFVAIDEAFGRGSEDSTRFGLQLFAKLDLQLLIVTPLQKIAVIEPFVAQVGLVTIENDQSSQIRNLTIETFRAEYAARNGG